MVTISVEKVHGAPITKNISQIEGYVVRMSIVDEGASEEIRTCRFFESKRGVDEFVSRAVKMYVPE